VLNLTFNELLGDVQLHDLSFDFLFTLIVWSFLGFQFFETFLSLANEDNNTTVLLLLLLLMLLLLMLLLLLMMLLLLLLLLMFLV